MSAYVAVVGPGSEASQHEVDLARQVGRRLAEAGCVVICGGLDGVMAAAAQGAREAGGDSVGLLPGWDRRQATGDLTVALPTGLGELRNGLVVRAADAVIAIGASWGTLSEIALAMRTATPVIAIDSVRVFAAGGAELALDRAEDAAGAVDAVLAQLRGGSLSARGVARPS